MGLPIPALALIFWFGGQGMTHHLLSYAYSPTQALKSDAQTQIQVQAAVLAIEIEVKSIPNFTKVSVKTTGSAIKTLDLEFLSTDMAEVEALIAQELNLSIGQVRKLARYQINSHGTEGKIRTK
ncbi:MULTISPECIES: hypothetical protein [unclassified Synechocystis]|uniref:hypothetical protein n=1 Tax=unclassified Synechocystis TaxID=2640012 RepID=UPI0003FCA36D|nr:MULTISPECIES: hypothetical protein [unclassified Synechocystis]AIE73444.1 hypothetical protein D082_09160 [Synechocystis sp. PCC 6714]MCT0254198.1 hypothetical protein [Synechocystis sp. CS-94]